MRGLSAAKRRQIEERIKSDPVFMPKIAIASEVYFYQKYTDQWGYKVERKIKAQVIAENPKNEPYQERLKLKILSGVDAGKCKWVGRANCVPIVPKDKET